VPTLSEEAEGHTGGVASARCSRTLRGQRPVHLLGSTSRGEPGDPRAPRKMDPRTCREAESVTPMMDGSGSRTARGTGKPRTRSGDGRGGGGGEGGRPKGTRASKTCPGHRAGQTRPVRWSGTSAARRDGKMAVHRAPPHIDDRAGCGRVLRTEEGCRPRRGRRDVAGTTREAGRNLQDLSARLKRGAVTERSRSAGVHPQGRRAAEAARRHCAGRQDRQAGDGRGAERIYETDFLGFSYRVPTRAQPAPCAGCALRPAS